MCFANRSRLFEVAAPVLTSERSAALRTFLRIFLLKPDELAGAVAALDAAAKAGAEPRFSDTNDAELRKYLHTRLSLVLRAYGSSASVRSGRGERGAGNVPEPGAHPAPDSSRLTRRRARTTTSC